MSAVRDLRMIGLRRTLAPALGGMVALSWLALWLWGRSPYGRLLGHAGLAADGALSVLPMYVVGWVLMTVAMMLPTSLPLVAMFGRITGARADRGRLVRSLVEGYIVVWAAFSVAAHLADRLLHRVAQGTWVEERASLVIAAVFATAGLYQFSRLKYYCLTRCRSPLVFITERWQTHRDWQHAFRLGIAHGLYCVGCCWSLMLLMFAVGVGNLGWMLALGAVMAAEKNLPGGRRVSRPIGATLLLAAAAVAAAS